MEFKKKLGNTDIFLPAFSVGTSTFGNMYGDMDISIMKNLVLNAIDNGLNYFDTSPYYGNKLSEINLGKALRGIPREDYILSTKVGRYGDDLFDFSESTINTSIDESLERLNTTYVDILLLHDVEFADYNQIINESLPAIEKLKKSGKVRYIGFSCYPINLIKRIVTGSKTKIDVILSYAHCCLMNNKLCEITDFLKSKKIGIINASPLCMGLLSTNKLPDWHPASSQLIDYIQEKSYFLNIKYKVNIEDYALNYVLYDTDIATTLVGIKTMSELEKLISILNGEIEFEDEIYRYIKKYIDKYFNIELE